MKKEPVWYKIYNDYIKIMGYGRHLRVPEKIKKRASEFADIDYNKLLQKYS